MSEWHGFPLEQDASWIGTGGTIGGEHTVGYYIADVTGGKAIAQIVNCPAAVSPDAPPAENQAPTFHYSTPIVAGEPKAVFNSSGICTTAGYVPGGRYYEVGADANHPSDPPQVKNARAAAIANIIAAAAELDALAGK
jgi:hypothetical protein